MFINAEKLRAKGWTEAEIKNTQKIVSRAKKHKHPHRRTLNEFIFWGMLFLAMGTMVIIAYWVIPIFMFAKSSILYPTIIIIGLSFGVLFTHVIKDLEHLRVHHHIMLIILVPLTGILSFLALLGSIQNVEAYGGIAHSPLIVGGSFIISFLIPYILHLSFKK